MRADELFVILVSVVFVIAGVLGLVLLFYSMFTQ